MEARYFKMQDTSRCGYLCGRSGSLITDSSRQSGGQGLRAKRRYSQGGGRVWRVCAHLHVHDDLVLGGEQGPEALAGGRGQEVEASGRVLVDNERNTGRLGLQSA